MPLTPYRRSAAVAYARAWALARNPLWYNFDALGGDCTNFVSQCLFAGGCAMDYAPNGWFYRSLQSRAPAWSGAQPLRGYLSDASRSSGPQAEPVSLEALEPGDVIFLLSGGEAYHSLIVSEILAPSPEGILVCAHTVDSLDRSLATYPTQEYAPFHVLGSG